MINLRSSAVLGLCLATAPSLLADFTYQETTKITGGAVVGMMKVAGMFSHEARKLGEPMISSVYLKGNVMARVNDTDTEIIDLDRGTVTTINHHDKTYTVMTFEQMRQQMEAARQEAEKKQAQETKSASTKSSEPPPDMKFKVNVRNTGANKAVAGLQASEAILAMELEATDKKSGQSGSLAMTNDMWLAPEIPGYEEIRDFERRYALKMGMVLRGAINPSMLALQPGMGQGLADMMKEMSKLKGVPVLQVMRVGATPNGEPLPAASEAPLPPAAELPTVGEMAQQTAASAATSAITSHMGAMGSALGGLSAGLGGFGRKKKSDAPPANTTAATATSAVLIESSTELTNFSSAKVDGSHLDVPSGYKQVQPKTYSSQ